MKSSIFRSENGFAAIAVILMASVISVLGTSFLSGMMSVSSRQSRSSTISSTMDSISLRLQVYARGSRNFQVSKDQSANSSFDACFDTGAGCPTGSTKQDITLLSTDGSKISGPPTSPMRYDQNGDVCNPMPAVGNIDCPFELITEYQVINAAPTYRIFYTIQISPSVTGEQLNVAGLGGGAKMRVGGFNVTKSFIIYGTRAGPNDTNFYHDPAVTYTSGGYQ